MEYFCHRASTKMAVVGRRSTVVLLVIGIAALTVYAYMGRHPKPIILKPFAEGMTKNNFTSGNSKTDYPTASTAIENRSLAIHMVVVPYYAFIGEVPEDQILQRQEEYRTALQRNLNHKFVSRVHVLTTSAKDTMERFKGLANHSKLVVAEVSSIEVARDPWDYISQNLVGKDAMFTNADIYLGDGFELVDPLLMAEQKIVYALTRHVAESEKCPGMSGVSYANLCLDKAYMGSHDSFLLHLTEPLPAEALGELEFLLPNLGMENVLLWIFQTMLKFCTLNPCRTLETFHFHCSYLRNNYKRPRVNVKDGVHWHNGLAPFTKKLLC